MKNLITAVLVFAALAFGGRWAWDELGDKMAADDAERRVSAALEGMREGGNEQTAATQFMEGVAGATDDAQLSRAWDHWMAWRREGGFATTIASYEIVGLDMASAVPVATVRIEGNTRRIAVPPGDELRWTD